MQNKLFQFLGYPLITSCKPGVINLVLDR